jgi:hypothetical protein
LHILSPDPQSVYQISPSLPLDSQKLHIIINGPSGLQQVTVYMDGLSLFTLTASPFEMWWMLQPGQHTLFAIGLLDDGSIIRSPDVTFTVQ